MLHVHREAILDKLTPTCLNVPDKPLLDNDQWEFIDALINLLETSLAFMVARGCQHHENDANDLRSKHGPH